MRKKFLMTLALSLALTLAFAPASAYAETGSAGQETEATADGEEGTLVSESEEDPQETMPTGETEMTGEGSETGSEAEDPEETGAPEEAEGEDTTPEETVPEESATGWKTVADAEGNEHTYYFEADAEGNPVQVKDCMKSIDGKTYLFDENGDVTYGFFATKADGTRVIYVTKDHATYTGTGWIKHEDQYYYMKNNYLLIANDGLSSVFVEKIQKVDEEGNPVVDENGNPVMVDQKRAWLSLNGAWYLMNAETGARLSGWQDAKGATYYLDPSNGDKMALGDNNGWKQIGSDWYNIQSWGGIRKDGWFYHKGWWYYLHPDGKMQAGGLLEYKGYKYLFYSWGGMYHDTYVNYGGNTYYTQSWGGAIKGDWFKDPSGKYRYFDDDAKMVKNKEIIYKGRTYHLDGNGYMWSDYWQKIGTEYAYWHTWGGKAVNDWIQYKGSYYFIDKNGIMMHDRWYNPKEPDNPNPSEKIYYLRSWGGRCAGGLFTINGKQYIFTADGRRTDAGYFWDANQKFRYFRNTDGSICKDLVTVDPNYVKTCAKWITVDCLKGIVTVYGWNKDTQRYDTPLKAMLCSVGQGVTQTPRGKFTTGWKRTVEKMVTSEYTCWAAYTTQFSGTVYFHAVASNNSSLTYISRNAFNALGYPASHGCVRLAACDAKWIYQYCKLGTGVHVGDNMDNPIKDPVRYAWTGGSIGADPTWTPLRSTDFVA